MTSFRSEELYTIVYYSSSKGWTDQTLNEILRVSRKNNAHLGITGFILIVDGSILQWLEGPKSVVENRFNIIKEDPRHSQLSTVLTHRLGERYFESWSMGFIPQREMSVELTQNVINLRSYEQRGQFIEKIPRLARLFTENFLNLNRA